MNRLKKHISLMIVILMLSSYLGVYAEAIEDRETEEMSIISNGITFTPHIGSDSIDYIVKSNPMIDRPEIEFVINQGSTRNVINEGSLNYEEDYNLETDDGGYGSGAKKL